MGDISRVALFAKLDSLAFKAMESAAAFCKLRGNPYVELAHWIHQILQTPASDLHLIVRAFDLDATVLARDLMASLDRLPRGATAITDLSAHLEDATERAWVWTTLKFGASQVRTAHLLVAMLKTRDLRNALLALSREFDKVKVDVLVEDLPRIVSGSPESVAEAAAPASGPAGASGSDFAAAQPGGQGMLQRFTVDLTAQARRGEIDPVVGRDEEIRQVIDILMRRRQNNPILTGEAGVGKTAVVEGFARRIAAGEVPPPLRDVELRSLDVGLLQAGASMKGEFENRLRQVIEEVQSSPKPIILFIDEAHTLIGAGGAAGTGDAANLLKPALARGNLRTIAATTWAEYKKYFEKDPALTRRFQVVQVHEPSEDKTILMMRGVASTLEKHHRVQILDEALEAAVRLSHRYIPARQLPDKAMSLMDTACARVAVSQHATPPEIEDAQRRIETLNTELEIIGREEAIGIDVAGRRKSVDEKLVAAKGKLAELEPRWKAEQELVTKVLGLRAKLREGRSPVEGTSSDLEKKAEKTRKDEQRPTLKPEEREKLLIELKQLQARLAAMQGEAPLVLPTADEQAVGAVVQDWTGIPVGRMVKNEIESVLKLADTLDQRVIGQKHGLEMIAKRVQTSRAKLDNPNKPIGVFMLAGPSGVGKTETALALAEALYGGEQNVITINMSEYQEAHTVSTLKGAPPGYVGYGEGGVLTEAVRRRPYSVVLLDEVEKAHSDVHEIFFQVFDKGWMEDGEGRYIDFKNTIILLTTNAGSELITNMCKDPELAPEPEALARALREPLLKVFPPALLGRIVTIPYYPLSDQMLATIIRLQIGRIKRRIEQNHAVEFSFTDEVVALVGKRCTELESGGRMIDAILTNTVLPRISEEFLKRMMAGTPVKGVALAVANGDFEYNFT